MSMNWFLETSTNELHQEIKEMRDKYYWNYRVVYHPPYKYTIGGKEKDADGFYAIHEVYYEKDIPVSYTTDFVTYGDTLEELKEIWDNVQKGLKKEVINYDFFNSKNEE